MTRVRLRVHRKGGGSGACVQPLHLFIRPGRNHDRRSSVHDNEDITDILSAAAVLEYRGAIEFHERQALAHAQGKPAPAKQHFAAKLVQKSCGAKG